MDRKKGKNSFIRNRKEGTTMVEVLVAFLVVMIMVAMFSKVVTVSIQMLNTSRQKVREIEAFNEEYYKIGQKDKASTVEGIDLTLVLSGENDTGKNGAKPVDIELTKAEYKKYENLGKVRYYFDIKD